MTFTEAQRETLLALADTFIPAMDGPAEHAAYWQRRGSEGVNINQIAEVVAEQPASAQAEFRKLLNLLDTPTLGITWFGPLRPFSRLQSAQREKLLQSWSQSNLPQLRKGFHALRKLFVFLYYGGSAREGGNPVWPSIGYAGPMPADAVVDVPKPIQTLQPTQAVTYECDVLVIGSGAGGGVVAGELAAAGHDVLVLEKGPYCHGCDFTQREVDMLGKLYDGKGTLSTQDGSISVLAGSCLGGGTTVNWAGAFRTPDYVLQEWAREHRVPHFTSLDFKKSLDAVSRALSVNIDYTRHNRQNQALWDGSTKLGQEVKLIPRNEKGLTDSETHFRGLGYSTMGDAYGIKQGTLNTYLLQAFRHGARLLADTRVERVTVASGRATGAEAVHTTASGQHIRVTVRARRVVVAGGAIQTPALLLRSGLRHPHLGRHLNLHPTVVVSGLYQQAMEPWFGPSMSVVNDCFTMLNGTNYGAKLETPPAHTGLMSMVLPWLSGAQHKQLMQQAAHMGSFIVLTRDRDGGRVSIDKHGQALIDYTLSEHDRGNMLTGARAAAEIHAAAGAHTVFLPHGSLPTLHIQNSHIQNPQVLDQLPHLSWKPNQYGLYSAHQMSTCRMGGDSFTHPIGPTGETYEVKNLFVADASAFPACSGVNPMLTIMALAHHTAQHLKTSGVVGPAASSVGTAPLAAATS
ncbi:GMC family oxidoreductase N-terminal domain-containing protein [Hymenobacter tibetensis]|uniref:long-chain-alcohol oxidase n=1 Tax=Hymenobacter tibetensis TaxID=497967 RepID=A0ABY4CWH4_9BACT|nr:GMC family oxidoreductase N-terminal domain-containing protein [Hymenobacter tibetensis]UOG74615.1 GMC family oxidoreductase N-terminal domain-containing protein [Hymenobacter tibetensis]